MTVEIKELIIRAQIINDSGISSQSDNSLDLAEKEQIIATCVEQVMRILERSKER